MQSTIKIAFFSLITNLYHKRKNKNPSKELPWWETVEDPAIQNLLLYNHSLERRTRNCH